MNVNGSVTGETPHVAIRRRLRASVIEGIVFLVIHVIGIARTKYGIDLITYIATSNNSIKPFEY